MTKLRCLTYIAAVLLEHLVSRGYCAGDKLQFGLAAERGKAEGHQVEMVLVGDDCSLPGQGVAGRRGIAGAMLVTKVGSFNL